MAPPSDCPPAQAGTCRSAGSARRAVAADLPVVVTSFCPAGRVKPAYGGGGGHDLEDARAIMPPSQRRCRGEFEARRLRVGPVKCNVRGFGSTTSLATPPHGRSAHRPTAVETPPNVRSEPHFGRAEARRRRAAPNQELPFSKQLIEQGGGAGALGEPALSIWRASPRRRCSVLSRANEVTDRSSHRRTLWRTLPMGAGSSVPHLPSLLACAQAWQHPRKIPG